MALRYSGAVDGLVDALAGAVGELQVAQLRGVGAAHADQVLLQPLFDDAFELPEKVQLGRLAGVAKAGEQQMPRQVHQQGGLAHAFGMHQRQVHAFANDAFLPVDGGADFLGAEPVGGVVVKHHTELCVGQHHAVALHPGKANLQRVTLGLHGFDLHGFARRCGFDDGGLGVEVKGDAQHVGVFDVEQAFAIDLVRLAAQRAANDLLAQQLGAKGAQPEHMGDVVGVPAFGKHGHRHHAADGLAQAARLAHGVHDFAQQLGVGKFVGGLPVARALDDFPAELLDLGLGHGPEVGVQCVARLQLRAVDQQGARACQALAVFVVVSKQRQAAQRGALGAGALEPGDVVVHQLGRRCVVAHHDEAGRHGQFGVGPSGERGLVMTVQSGERGLQLQGDGQGVQALGGVAPFFGHLFADVLPQVAKHRHLGSGNVVRHWHARQLDDAALDSVHQREVAHGPGEQSALDIARAAQEEGRGRQVDHPAQAQLALHDPDAVDPQSGGFVVLFGFFFVVALEVFYADHRLGPLLVAVVRLVVDHQNVFQTHQ